LGLLSRPFFVDPPAFFVAHRTCARKVDEGDRAADRVLFDTNSANMSAFQMYCCVIQKHGKEATVKKYGDDAEEVNRKESNSQQTYQVKQKKANKYGRRM